MLKQHLAAFAAAIAIFIPFTANAEAPDLKSGMPVIYLADNLDEKDKLGWCMSRQLVFSNCESAENKLKQLCDNTKKAYQTWSLNSL
jgi:hypothetical protein